jgi:hypothetical protein
MSKSLKENDADDVISAQIITSRVRVLRMTAERSG